MQGRRPWSPQRSTFAPAPKRAKRTATGGLALTALLLASCGRPTGSLRDQTRQWVASSGFLGIQASIRTDAAQIGAERHQGHVRQAGLDCVALGTDASKLEGQLPTPSRALSDQLDSAYVNLIHYAGPCATNSGRVTPAQALAETRGLAQLAVADRELSDLLAGRRLPNAGPAVAGASAPSPRTTG